MARSFMPHYQDRPESEFKEEVISVDRVSRVQKGGRRFRFRALVVVGNGKGEVGLAVAKAADVPAAVDKAAAKAQKQTIQVPLVRGTTIPHQISARYAGAHVLLKPAGPGTGVIASTTIRPILEAAGIKD